MGKLTAKFVKTAPPGRHGDGRNLYLLVQKSGSKSWVLRYQNNGNRHDIGLGSLALTKSVGPEALNISLMGKRQLTLSEARKKAKILHAKGTAGEKLTKEYTKEPGNSKEAASYHEKDMDDQFTVTDRERSITPPQWIEKHSRHMRISRQQRRSWTSRLSHLWQLQHGPQRSKPTYDDLRFQIEMLHLELEYTPNGGNFALQITNLVRQFQSSKNPTYIDFALILCERETIFIPPTLVEITLQAAKVRVESDRPSITPAKISNQLAMNRAMLMMTNLIMSGITQDKAASKTAQLLVDENSPYTWKASTLDKLYSEQAKAKAKDMTMVKTFQKMWLHAGPDTKEKWRSVSAELPEACDRVKGERR